ncbi:cysteine hydrolase family protein [Chryseolinea lacunae]|uniref:Cysteine hydrolase n=1 Tax=Chryseolinea lacunae TaxID=2801331 RepID=A0ABS1KTI6_9BACT|nr:cysteine hydrolase family protein [Chryseolinea lacunae]MBL0742784.1 cysteine hydrolase [Chryseolinea lacunae]
MKAAGKTALMLIDVQHGIDAVAHWGGNRNNPEAEENIERLLRHCRALNCVIVIVQHDSVSPTSPFRPGQRGNELKDFVNVLAGEKSIHKSTTSAFMKTDLLQHLQTQGVSKLIITGFVTNNSVEATARMAGEFGFDTTVVSDATATFDKVLLDGTKQPSALIHQISLSNLNGEYATIATTQEVMAALRPEHNPTTA